MKYKRGEINPVSALHQFAQMQRVQLDLKETVTTGKYQAMSDFCDSRKVFFPLKESSYVKFDCLNDCWYALKNILRNIFCSQLLNF